MPVNTPTLLTEPFANTGGRNVVPVSATGSNKAAYTTGFPPVTMQPVAAGGLPPEGKDFNGVLYDITTHTIWVEAGGQYKFDPALVAAIGGYPQGMVLQSDDGLSAYVSLVDNNSVNFNTTPASIGVQWGAWAGVAVTPALNVPTVLYFGNIWGN